jgi:hypothetical protein
MRDDMRQKKGRVPSGAAVFPAQRYRFSSGAQAFSAASTSSSIFFASPNSMRLFSL